MAMVSSNRISYSQRLFAWMLGYSLLLVGCFVAFQYHREKEFKAELINARLQLINTYIIDEIDEGINVSDIDLAQFKSFDNLRVSVISVDGHVVYDNTLDSLPESSHLDRVEMRQALKHDTGFAVRRHSESTGDNYFYSAKNSGKGYIARTAVPYSVSLISLLQADFGFLWGMGLIALSMCILAYYATRRIGLHIKRLKEFSENVENGVRISDVQPFTNDELGEISNHIVRLYARLQQAIADRDSEHQTAMFEQLEKERIKKQLTNNINHELKTPIASIRICVETLLTHKNLSVEKQDLFLQRCLTNIDRLQRLLTDVSILTRMDDGSAMIVKEPLNLTDIINDVVEDRRIFASTKGITIDNGITDPIFMSGNSTLLEAVFNNLIDNAIIYSEGTSVRLSLIGDYSDKVVISLSDNGVGVPKEHLLRIFERFYRIDKGRSRAAGGTGLGLSIVKNAVILHGGSITARNFVSGGLCFEITLPKGA